MAVDGSGTYTAILEGLSKLPDENIT